jgi:FMN phosphatase YigB (HAD superfamily)
MPLTLEQYATYLDTRRDLPWPAPPEIDPPKAKPHLTRLPDVRAVLWSVYGTLVHLAGGELYFEHPQQFIMDVALDKTIQEFKMWGSMPRKPGHPADYLRRVYTDILTDQRMAPSGGEKFPEVVSERIWEAFIKKLFQKDYKFDATFYGSLNEYSRKVAYFFHASLQGTACYPGAAEALRYVTDQGLTQGLLGDGQCFTLVQLQHGLAKQDPSLRADEVLDPALRLLSADVRARKPSERLFRQALGVLAERGISPGEVLHVGSNLARDLAPARRLGMKTALFIADKAALQLSPEQLKQALKEPVNRPDVLLTELPQIADIV